MLLLNTRKFKINDDIKIILYISSTRINIYLSSFFLSNKITQLLFIIVKFFLKKLFSIMVFFLYYLEFLCEFLNIAII